MPDRHCENCGHELVEGDRFCPNCGTPVLEAAPSPASEADVPVPPLQQVRSNQPAPDSSVAAEQARMQQPLEVSLSPQQVIEGAMMRMTSAGYAVEATYESSVTFSRNEGPSVIVGLILLIFLILPGIIYFLMPRGLKHTTLMVVGVGEEPQGARVTLGGDDFNGQRTLRAWMDTLPRRS